MKKVKNANLPSIIEILWKIVPIIFAASGVYLQARLDGGLFKTYVFLYYTIISNLGTAIIFALMFIMQIIERCTKKVFISNKIMVVKYMFTASMMLTLIVSLCILAPFKTQAYLFSFRNLSLHIFAPFAAVVDLLFFDKRFNCRIRTAFLGFVIPTVWLTVTLLLSIRGITYSNGTLYPYFFLDYRALGWLTFETGKIGVIWWILIVALIAFVSSLLLTGVKVIINKFRIWKHKIR